MAEQAILELAQNDNYVEDSRAVAILDFLYLTTENYDKPEKHQDTEFLWRIQTLKK